MSTVLYDKIGTRYDETRKADQKIINRIYDIFDPQNSERFLDIGCGTGNYTIALARKGMNITGVDISEEMLVKARAKMESLPWVQADAKALPFPDRSFEGVLCFLAIHHIGNLLQFFNEVYRVLCPGGKFLIFTNSPNQFKQL